MENRFGLKDFVLMVLMVVAIVLIVLKMIQDDRQWDQLRLASATLQEHTRDLARIQGMLREGVAVNANAGQSVGPVLDDAFTRIREAQKAKDYAIGDFYVNSDQTPPDKLTPIISSDLFSTNLQKFVLETLLDRDPDTLEWKPLLARSWKVSEDGLTISFEMRRDATFSDGTPVTADDVIWTFNWIMNPDVEAPRVRMYYDKLTSVVKQGDHGVVFTFKEPYFKSLEVAALLEVLPSHFYSQFTPKQFNESVGILMGSGPYRLADPKNWSPQPGRPIELIRNERYWGPQPPFEKLMWRIMENPAARLTAFRNGEIDILTALPEQYVQLLKDPDLLKRSQHFEMMRPTSGYLYAGWNTKREGKETPFKDKRVRQAMTLLTDRNAIIDQVILGYGNVATGPFHPLSKQSDPSIAPWPYDPERAKSLLREAGFIDRNNDGVLDGPDGKPFRFDISYPSTSTTLERAALMMKDSFQRAGIIGTPRPTEWSVLLKNMDERKFDSAILGWGGTLETDLHQVFHSDMIKGTGDNNTQYSNPELDKVIEQARTTMDEEKRNKLWHKAQAILHEDQPYTFLFNSKTLAFVDGRFKNIQRVRTGLNPALEWYVPVDQRKWAK